MGFSEVNIMKLYKSPLSTIEDPYRPNTDLIVEKFKRFVRYVIENQLIDHPDTLKYEINHRRNQLQIILKTKGRL